MALGPNDFDAIEIAVRTTGTQAVTDLQAKLAGVTQQIAGYKAGLAAGLITANDFIANTRDLIEQQRKLEAAVTAAGRVLAGQSAAFVDAQGKAYGAQRAVLELSRGFEDFATGGFLGVVNNIPGAVGGIAQAVGVAAPAVAKLEGAAALLATTAYLVYQNWDRIKKLFDDGLGQKTLDDVKDIEKALKELTEKQWKTRIDVQDIQIAKRELEELKEAQQGYDGLNARSEADKKRGKAVSEAVVEGGGREAVTRAVLAATVGPETEEVKATRAKLASFDARMKAAEDSGNGQLLLSLMEDRERLLKSDSGKTAIQDQNRRTAVERQLGLAGRGDPLQADWLRGLFEQNQDKFRAAGVDLDRFGGGMEAARGENLFAEERRKRQEKEEQEAKRAADHADDVAARARDEMVKNMDQGAAIVEREANRAADDEANQRTKRNNDAQALRDKAAAERKKKVDQVDQAFTGPAAAMFAQNSLRLTQNQIARGQGMPEPFPVATNLRREKQLQAMGQEYALPPEVVGNRVEARIAHDLRQSGNDPGLAPDIRTRAGELFKTKEAEARARTPTPDPSQAIATLGERQGRTMAGQIQTTAALIQVMAELGARMNQQDAQVGKNLQNVGMLRAQMPRQRQQRPTLLNHN